MLTEIRLDLDRQRGTIDRNIFGGFAEHLGRCIYGGIYDPDSPLAGHNGLRTDVLAALHRLRMPIIRYPGGNFASGYRWRDGVGSRLERPTRLDLAWHALEPNTFGTNEFIYFCRQLRAEPYLVVNCGDGDLREARDWVEYCNGTQDTALVKLRREHGYYAPHQVKYWGIGNEVDGQWQIGYKTPQEYARAFVEFGKVMKWVDPEIRLIASATSSWAPDWVERFQLLLEAAGRPLPGCPQPLLDYLSIHWYVGNREDDFAGYMALSELFEERLSACEGLIRAVSLAHGITHPVALAVDEWNVWYRTGVAEKLEEVYNLEDALVTALQLNAFIRHARSVRMANLAQIVNVIAPILTRPDGLVCQTIYYPFELYSQHCGDIALDPFWAGETFAGRGYTGIRVLDVAATLDTMRRQVALFVVNRSADQAVEAEVTLAAGQFSGPGQVLVVNGPDIKASNTFDAPDQVDCRKETVMVEGRSWRHTFEPHSVTALVCPVAR
jgi:alpha-N-arabinofuranosidase